MAEALGAAKHEETGQSLLEAACAADKVDAVRALLRNMPRVRHSRHGSTPRLPRESYSSVDECHGTTTDAGD